MGYRSKLFAALGCAIATWLAVPAAEAQLFTTTRELERQARVQWLTMKRQTPLAPEARTQAYVQCITDRIIDVLDDSHANLAWEVVVFDDDSANAFALPGGKVGVFTGILRVADTPDALAAVIGHEIAHLTENHVTERARRAGRADALVLLGGAATGMGDLIRMGATVGLTLPFDRRQETESDLVGLDYMARAGFDPRASLYLWKNMSAMNRSRPPEFLSTHPSSDRRLDDLVKALTPALVTYNQALEAGRRPNCRP